LSFQEYWHFHGTDLPTTATQPLPETLLAHDLSDCVVRQDFYQQYLKYGGFPEVVMTPASADKQLVLKNIFSSFFEKDLQLLSDYKDIRELRDLILLLAPRVGSLLDITRLASELGVDRKKVYGYLEFLQGTFFLRLLTRFSHSIDRAVAGGKKVYFTDTGILQLLGEVNEAQIFENAVVNQLADYGQLSFYNKRNTAEIDVILNKTMAFEIKTTGTEQDLSKLEKLAQELKLTDWYIVSKNHRTGKRFVCADLL
jgi:predicted AAA+ superfamily ATPase